MGKSASQKQQVSEYYMSIHSGLCVGPIDAITGLYVGEKLAWEGEVTQGGNIAINAPSLFGGNKDGGGVGGIMVYLPGGPNQVLPNELARRQGLTSATSPGYRSVASVYFIGLDSVPAGSIDTSGSGGVVGGGSGGTGGDGSGTPGGGGGSVGCPVSTALVLLANEDRTGPGPCVPAGALRPNMDWVWSRHEHTGRWAAYPVTHKRLLHADIWHVPGRPLTSGSHLWHCNDEWGWIRSDFIGTATGTNEVVVALTIGGAHTYTLIGDDGVWLVSHNKTSEPSGTL